MRVKHIPRPRVFCRLFFLFVAAWVAGVTLAHLPREPVPPTAGARGVPPGALAEGARTLIHPLLPPAVGTGGILFLEELRDPRATGDGPRLEAGLDLLEGGGGGGGGGGGVLVVLLGRGVVAHGFLHREMGRIL